MKEPQPPLQPKAPEQSAWSKIDNLEDLYTELLKTKKVRHAGKTLPGNEVARRILMLVDSPTKLKPRDKLIKYIKFIAPFADDPEIKRALQKLLIDSDTALVAAQKEKNREEFIEKEVALLVKHLIGQNKEGRAAYMNDTLTTAYNLEGKSPEKYLGYTAALNAAYDKYNAENKEQSAAAPIEKSGEKAKESIDWSVFDTIEDWFDCKKQLLKDWEIKVGGIVYKNKKIAETIKKEIQAIKKETGETQAAHIEKFLSQAIHPSLRSALSKIIQNEVIGSVDAFTKTAPLETQSPVEIEKPSKKSEEQVRELEYAVQFIENQLATLKNKIAEARERSVSLITEKREANLLESEPIKYFIKARDHVKGSLAKGDKFAEENKVVFNKKLEEFERILKALENSGTSLVDIKNTLETATEALSAEKKESKTSTTETNVWTQEKEQELSRIEQQITELENVVNWIEKEFKELRRQVESFTQKGDASTVKFVIEKIIPLLENEPVAYLNREIQNVTETLKSISENADYTDEKKLERKNHWNEIIEKYKKMIEALESLNSPNS